MAAPRSTPTTRMRELAERLRELRIARDLTVESVAQSLLVSASKISRLETAQRRASPRDVRDLCLLYGVSHDERDRLMLLASQALETTWYQDADIDAVYGTFIGLEEAATHISAVHSNTLPGLFQTAGYSRAMLVGIRPPGQLPADRIEELIRVRRRRQEILERPVPPVIHSVIDEVALRRPIGSAEEMVEQIERLVELSQRDNVTIQLIPMNVGPHPGLDGRFTVLRFADQVVRDTVYVEGLLGELFLDKDSDVDRYMEIFHYTATSAALKEDESRDLLLDIRTSWQPV